MNFHGVYFASQLERFGIVLSGDMTVSLFFFLSHTVGNLTYRYVCQPGIFTINSLPPGRFVSNFSAMLIRSVWSYGVTRPQWVNLYRDEFVLGEINNPFAFSIISQHSDGIGSWNPSLWKPRAHLYYINQYLGCWWPGDTRSPTIYSHGIDHICQRHSNFSTRRV